MPGNFYDTNVLVYLASGYSAKADAAERAISLGGTISVQVLNEFAHVSRRKMGFSWAEVHSFLATIRGALSVVPVTVAVHELGLELAECYGFSLYDAMIVAAALANGCDTLFTEDLQDGLSVADLVVVNPFKAI
jgi:predicted nucleic acid-binding protein